MPAKKNEKWSSSVSLTKFFSRLTRTLSFSSKKHQKKNTEQSPSVAKNFPKSVPVPRRHPPQPIDHYRQGVQVNMFEESDEEDYSRYSLRPNLSLFNISTDNLQYQSEEVLHGNWLDEIFHSTKIEH